MINFFRSSKNIAIFSVVSFLLVLIVFLTSAVFMNVSIYNQEEAYENLNTYRQLGNDLADTSDYLTKEARLFAVTHDISHLNNYWIEVRETKTRDYVIEMFEQSNLSEEEKGYLKAAKQYSDELIEVETLSMKLILLSDEKTSNDFSYDARLADYVSDVLNYELPNTYRKLSRSAMASNAISILYDDNYENYKESIMSPIEFFQSIINAHLENEVKKALNGTGVATVLLLVSSTFTLVAIGILLLIFYKMYLVPVVNYTKSINHVYAPSVKVEPQGALEMIDFGKAFNRLSDNVYSELNNRKRAEENMRLAKNEAIVANRAKSIFLASMSHELRLPLNAINGYTELLMETPLSEKQSSYVLGLRSSTDYLLGTINNILDYSKFESGKMIIDRSDFRLKTLLDEVSSVIGNLSRQKNLHYELNCDDAIPPVLNGDSLRLGQLLVNIANNAVKFTEKGGVKIDVELVSSKKDYCVIRFTVTDTGIGIDSKSVDSIFNAFVQQDASVARKYGGTGLGLSICRQIVNCWSDGEEKITVKSKVGQGSSFSFKLPFGVSDKQIEEETVEKPMYSGEKILIVDDSEINIHVECEMLANCGLNVITANNGRTAVQKMQDNPDIRLVFMDIRMPDMDGYEATERIHKLDSHRSTAVIALTGDVMPETEEKVKKCGMTDYIRKPFRKSNLYYILRKHLKGYSNQESKNLSVETGYSEYFDAAALYVKIGKNYDVFLSIIKMFLDEYGCIEKTITKLQDDSDFKQAYGIIHKLKGSSGSICCEKLFKQCDEFADTLRCRSFDGADKFLSVFRKTYSEIRETYTMTQNKDVEN